MVTDLVPLFKATISKATSLLHAVRQIFGCTQSQTTVFPSVTVAVYHLLSSLPFSSLVFTLRLKTFDVLHAHAMETRERCPLNAICEEFRRPVHAISGKNETVISSESCECRTIKCLHLTKRHWASSRTQLAGRNFYIPPHPQHHQSEVTNYSKQLGPIYHFV